MFYKLYKSIKTEMQTLTFAKAISWYNNQFEEGLGVDTGIYIEFNPDTIKQLMSKDAGAVEMPIRLWFAKKIVAATDGTIKDTEIEAFNNQLADILALVDNLNPMDDELNQLTLRPLQLAGVTPFQKISGWQIWQIDLTAKVDKTALKNALETFAITTATTGNGTGTIATLPANTSAVKKGQLVVLSANPATGSQFVKWVADGIEYTTSMLTLKATKDLTATAEFLSSLLVERLKTFHTSPVARGNRTYFGDYAKANDVLIKGQRAAIFSSTSYINNNLYQVGGEPIDIEFDTYRDVKGVGATYISLTDGNALTKGFFACILNSNVWQFRINDGSGAGYTINYNGFPVNGYLKVRILWDGQIGSLVTITVNDGSYSFTAPKTWTGNSTRSYIFGSALSTSVSYFKVAGKFEYYFNHGQGATIYDVSGNGNHATIVNAVLSNFWNGYIDQAPAHEHTLGATLYRNTTDNSIMPISMDLTGVEKAGFTNLGYFAPGSGILKGLPNKYNITGCSPIINDGDYTADQIAAFTTSPNLELEQNANAVTSLIVKN